MIEKILLNIVERVLNKEPLLWEDAIYLTRLKTSDVLILAGLANKVRENFIGNSVDLCSILNAKSGNCPEDCKFCAQSIYYKTSCPTYPLVEREAILSAAWNAKRNGAGRFCIVTSGRRLKEKEFRRILSVCKEIKSKIPIELDCSLGELSRDEFLSLKEAGVSRYNHNIETAKSYFSKICSTHSYEDRVRTITAAKEAGLEVCCGGIIGLGETWEERLEFFYALAELDVDCIPINILNPRPGTPLEHVSVPPPMEIIKAVAILRLLVPNKTIKLAGGRERNLRDLQALCMVSGASGMIIGGYLTTKGREVKDDLKMLADLELI